MSFFRSRYEIDVVFKSIFEDDLAHIIEKMTHLLSTSHITMIYNKYCALRDNEITHLVHAQLSKYTIAHVHAYYRSEHMATTEYNSKLLAL